MTRQWDDWRCYRCNRWRPAGENRAEQVTPAGYTFGVCVLCAAEASGILTPTSADGVAPIGPVPSSLIGEAE